MNGGDACKAVMKLRKKSLAAGVAALLGLTSPAAFATVFVSNCNDSGIGSLRSAVSGAPSGETVDASGLAGVCSKITVRTGAIKVDQTDLTIIGPGVDKLSVTAAYDDTYQYYSRIFTHSGTGLLYLQNMTVTHGYVLESNAQGGCIVSKGSVMLKGTAVTRCKVRSTGANGTAVGGGISAEGSLTMKQSTLNYNSANGGSSGGIGGGVASHGFRAYYSSINGNTATSDDASRGQGGGVASFNDGAVYIYNSTIASNKSSDIIGGLEVFGAHVAVKIANSTISSNVAVDVGGGAYLQVETLQIFNSTIAGNTAGKSYTGFPAGLTMRTLEPTATFELHSTIIAGNLYGSPPVTDNDLSSAVVVTGSNNVIQASNASVPTDTIMGKCAFLGPLQDNGGLTLTQAPLGHSPAIDKGNNTFGASFDQRGKQSVNGDANYPRVLGAPGVAARADIGAYEVNGADEIYDSDFDSC